MVSLSIRQLARTLSLTPASHNVMLVGRHGIGKSEILTHLYEGQGCKVVSLFLGQMADSGDLIGLPRLEEGRTVFAPPYWFPSDGTPVVLFLDELNRARPEMLQAVMELALHRTVAGRALPAGSRVIAAVNDGDEYQLTPLDPALVSRFNVYQFCPTVEEWLLWAEQHALDDRVVRFLAANPSLLDGTPQHRDGEDLGLEREPDRRAWLRVSDVLSTRDLHGRPTPRPLEEDDLPLLSGIIGASAASLFYHFAEGHHTLSPAQLLDEAPAHEQELRSMRLHQLAVLNEGVMRLLELQDYDPDHVPADTATRYTRYAEHLTWYVSLLETMEQREAIAHLANLFMSGGYDKAVLFLTDRCPAFAEKMATFIAQL